MKSSEFIISEHLDGETSPMGSNLRKERRGNKKTAKDKVEDLVTEGVKQNIASAVFAAILAFISNGAKAETDSATRIYAGHHVNDWIKKDLNGQAIVDSCGAISFDTTAAHRDLAAHGLDSMFAYELASQFSEASTNACQNKIDLLKLQDAKFKQWADEESAAQKKNTLHK